MNGKKKKKVFETLFLLAVLQLASGKSIEISTYARQSRNGDIEMTEPRSNGNERAMNGASFYPQNVLFDSKKPANIFYRPIGPPLQRRVDMEKFDLKNLPESIDHAPAGYEIIKADPHDHHHHHDPPPPSPPPPPPPKKQGLLKPIHRYKFFQVERQLWWAPLYFTIYFVFYCSMLVIRFLMRRGLQLPNKYKDRSFGLGNWSDMTNTEMAEKVDTMARYTMKLIDGYAEKVKNEKE